MNDRAVKLAAVCTGSLVVFIAGAGRADSQISPGDASIAGIGAGSAVNVPGEVFPVLERPVDPAPKGSARVVHAVEPAQVWRRGTFDSVQVNVDNGGNNIVGDAANEPSIAIDPTDPDTIIIGWRQFDTIADSFRTSGYAYSHDGGQTWTFPGVLEPGEFSSDPVLDFDLDGNIYYNGLQPNRGPGDWACYIYKTFDGGLTWPQEVYAFGGDKQWMSIDRTGGIGTGNLYMHWSPFAGCCDDNLFTRSTDGGLTFMPPVPLPQNPFFGTQTVGPDGELYIVGGINYPVGPFVVLRSDNAKNPAVTPTFPLLGPLGVLPLPTKWVIRIGEPVALDHLEPDAASDELLVSRLTEELRSQIQSLVEVGLSDRESIWG